MCWTKAKSALVFGRESAVGAEAVVILMDCASRPLGGERRIGHDGVEAQIGVLGRGMLQGVLVLQVEALIVNAVQDHVHPRKVVSCGVHLLPVEAANFFDFLRHP